MSKHVFGRTFNSVNFFDLVIMTFIKYGHSPLLSLSYSFSERKCNRDIIIELFAQKFRWRDDPEVDNALHVPRSRQITYDCQQLTRGKHFDRNVQGRPATMQNNWEYMNVAHSTRSVDLVILTDTCSGYWLLRHALDCVKNSPMKRLLSEIMLQLL